MLEDIYYFLHNKPPLDLQQPHVFFKWLQWVEPATLQAEDHFTQIIQISLKYWTAHSVEICVRTVQSAWKMLIMQHTILFDNNRLVRFMCRSTA